MKLGPFVTSKASIGSTSAAAGQDVRNAINTGYNKMQNSQTTAQFGSQMMKTSIAADLNKQRATVAAAENNARSAIEQNPDYIDADIVEDMGVEVDEANVIEDENGKRRVRTYSIAEELYSKSVEAGVTEADNRLSFPSVGKRLNDEVSAKYRNAGQNKIATWAVHKQRDLTRQETEVTLDGFRENGQYPEAMETISTMEAAGVFSPAQAESQRERTNVSEEMRGTHKLIMAAQEDYENIEALHAQVDKYEEALDSGASIVNGMDSDTVYRERNRMLAAINSIENARSTRQAVSMVDATKQLAAVGPAIAKGLNTMGAAGLNQHTARYNQMVATGAGTETQRENYRYAIRKAGVMINNAPEFNMLMTGGVNQARETYAALRAEAMGMTGDQAPEALVLLNAATEVMNKRESMLNSRPNKYAEENDEVARQSRGQLEAARASGNRVAYASALGEHIDVMEASLDRLGTDPSKRSVLDQNDPIILELKHDLKTASWEQQNEIFRTLDTSLTPGQYASLARSISSSDEESAVYQMAMLAYGDDPELSRKIITGSRLENTPVDKQALHVMINDTIGQTLPPETRDAMVPGLEALYRANVAMGADKYSKAPNANVVTKMVNEALGPPVKFQDTSWWWPNNPGQKAFPHSADIRSYRTPAGGWAAPKQVHDQLIEAVIQEDRLFQWRGGTWTATEMSGGGSWESVSNGVYRLNVPVGDGRMEPLLDPKTGQPWTVDLLRGQR